MRERRLGMTQTYNLLLDPDRDDEDIEILRRCHEAVDRLVLEAYGWVDVAVPAYQSPAAVEFADAVAGRLFALNAQRASSSVQKEGPGLRRAREEKGPGMRKASPSAATSTKRRAAKAKG
jgi:hypothetical protein